MGIVLQGKSPFYIGVRYSGSTIQKRTSEDGSCLDGARVIAGTLLARLHRGACSLVRIYMSLDFIGSLAHRAPDPYAVHFRHVANHLRACAMVKAVWEGICS